MEYEKIILDLMNRIVILEEKVSMLEQIYEQPQEGERSSALPDTRLLRQRSYAQPQGSKKYRFLSDYLHESNQHRIKLSYEEIEKILQFKLPESAAVHRAFWANTTSHSIALSWLSVDYSVVEANLEKRYIVFEKRGNLKGF